MPTVTHRSGQLTDPVLTNLGRGYRPEGFIADQVCPRIAVAKESGKYPVWEPRDFFASDVDALVPDRAVTKEIEISLSTEPYVAEEYALKVSVSRREADNVDAVVRLRQSKLNAVNDQLTIARELRVAQLLNTLDATPAGGLDNSMDATPSNNWNVDAGTIETDILTAKEAIYDAIGIEPNTIVVPYKVANAIAIQQDIRELFKYTVDGRSILGAGQNILPPEIWGLRTLIPRSRRATNAEGAANTLVDIWGDDVRVLYVSANPDLYNPSVAHSFVARSYQVKTWMSDDPDVEYIRPSEVLDERVVAPFGGYVIKDVLS